MIECTECGWIDDPSECLCSQEDAASEKATHEIQFNLCPQCSSVDTFDDLDEEEDHADD
jgi:rubredoxin